MRQRQRSIAAALACAIALGVATFAVRQPVAAEGSPIDITLESPYRGGPDPGGWLPLQVNVRNQGGDFRGHLVVRAQGGGSAGWSGYTPLTCAAGALCRSGNAAQTTGSVTYRLPLAVAAGSSKRISLETAPNAQFIHAEVIDDASGSVVASGDQARTGYVGGGTANAVVAVVSDDVNASLEQLSKVRLPVGRYGGYLDTSVACPGCNTSLGGSAINALSAGVETRVVHLKPEELPSSALGLQALTAVVMDNATTANLTAAQRSALSDYVEGGGALITAGGARAGQTLAGLPPGLLPVQVLGVRQSSLAGLTPILGAPPFSGSVDASSVRVLKGSAVYAEDSGPLVIDSPQGLGHTVFIAFDPSQDSFSAWPGSTALLRRILARTHPEGIGVVFAGSNEVSGITQHATALQSAVTTIPPLNLPSAEVLSVVLIVYILAVGPVNFIVLRRMRRLDLTWATVPAISLVAALLAYGTGLGAARYDAVANSIHVLNVEPDGKRAYVESFAAVYLPHGGTHSLLVPKETSFAPLPGVSSADPAVTVDGDSGTVSVEGASASVHGYSSAGYRDLPGGITTALVRRGGHLVGTVSNHLPSTLSNVTVVAPDGSSVTLADIAPGGSDPVDVQESVPGTGFPSPPVPAPLGQGNPLAARGAISRGPAGAPPVTVATCSVNGVQVPCASGGSSCSSNGFTVGCSGGPTTCFVNGLKVPCQSQPITSGSTQEQREQANRDAVLAALRAPSLDQRPRLVALVTRALFPGELSGTNTQTTGLDAVVIPLRTSGASEVRVPGHLVDSPGSSVKVPAFSNIGAQTVLPPGQGAVFEFSLPSTSWQALTLNITGQLQQYHAGNQQTVPVPQAPGGPQAPTVQPTPTATVDVFNVATGAWDAVATRVLTNPATVAVAAPQHVAEDGSLLVRVTANSSTDFLNVPTLDATPLDNAPGAIPGQQTS